MVIEKAIEMIDDYLLEPNSISPDWVEVLKMCRKALKKQAPTMVTHEATLYRCCTCPTCKNVVDKFEKFGERTVRVTYAHCQICGQALDWEKGGEIIGKKEDTTH